MTSAQFWANVVVRENDCWEWTGPKLPAGYGRTTSGGGYAHRAAWIEHYGSIPTGMHVCHACDNPACCNPLHLFIGTPGDNARDRAAKGRNGWIHVGPKIDRNQAEAIRCAYSGGGRSQRSIAREFGISQSMVSKIVNEKTWTLNRKARPLAATR